MTRAILPAFLLLLTTGVSANSPSELPQASTTRLVPFSGVIVDAAGTALSGPRSITFALFDEAVDGTLLWTETQTISVDERGRYSAHLGALTPLPLEIFRTEQARWLEVSVDGKALPRTMLVAVPYALRAADAETLGGRPLSNFVLTDAGGRRVRADGTTIDDPAVDGSGVPNQLAKWSSATTLSSSVVAESADNRIGIFAPDPTGGGVVDSRFTIRHLDNNTAFGVLNTSNQRRFALNTLSNGGWTIYDGANATWNAGLSQSNGNIGVGTSPFPLYRVRVLGGSTLGGIYATALNDRALQGESGASIGVIGFSGSGQAAVAGTSFGSALAGLFSGNVSVSGTLTKGAGAFQIDHPLDPANKYLSHSFVESPDMMNVYNGNVTLDANGEAWVTLPDWFEALNRDFRYQLTAIGAPGPNLHIAAKISGNRFKIAGGVAAAEVSWMVTGIRQDAFANAHRIPVEHDKPSHERGLYQHPAAFGLPAAMGIPSLRLVPSSIREK